MYTNLLPVVCRNDPVKAENRYEKEGAGPAEMMAIYFVNIAKIIIYNDLKYV